MQKWGLRDHHFFIFFNARISFLSGFRFGSRFGSVNETFIYLFLLYCGFCDSQRIYKRLCSLFKHSTFFVFLTFKTELFCWAKLVFLRLKTIIVCLVPLLQLSGCGIPEPWRQARARPQARIERLTTMLSASKELHLRFIEKFHSKYSKGRPNRAEI